MRNQAQTYDKITALHGVFHDDFRIKIEVSGFKTVKERKKLVSEFRRYLTGFQMVVDNGKANCKIVSLRGLPD